MITLSVPEMMCNNCVKRVTNALNGQNMKFTVSLDSKTVELDEGEDRVPAAIAALDEIGFDAAVK